ncbi:citrate lyase ACP [Propionigenium maris DSM 9537]|uniref:Citrate lyase ACP n=1 Tax=Propionigenium maris DSM 9537 TaxID=1123000 RepID=A0A9W6LNL7_9FUSO|nr:citrate lyase acyl carrier protein [Propionigenium maris]GLI57496.1 citrate lyase ACP [Propionigenium maris DSM 9537]
MKITKTAVVGNVESNDLMIIVSPGEGLTLNIESSVYEQFGSSIEAIIREELAKAEIRDAHIQVEDKGAFDFTIRARLKTAIRRAQ